MSTTAWHVDPSQPKSAPMPHVCPIDTSFLAIDFDTATHITRVGADTLSIEHRHDVRCVLPFGRGFQSTVSTATNTRRTPTSTSALTWSVWAAAKTTPSKAS